MVFPGWADTPSGMCRPAVIVAIALAFALEAQAQLSGVVRVTTTLTKKRITIPQVYERNVAVAPPAAESHDIAAELRRVVVYIDSDKLPSRAVRVTMNQAQRHFEPEVVAVPVGSTVSFPNSDAIFHNVFSLSEPKPFDLGNYKEGDTRMVTFDRPGSVQVHCHLHANMSGAILVTPNSWVVQPAADGTFTMPPVPPGNYTLVAWHKAAGQFRREVVVHSGESIHVNFEIPILEAAHR